MTKNTIICSNVPDEIALRRSLHAAAVLLNLEGIYRISKSPTKWPGVMRDLLERIALNPKNHTQTKIDLTKTDLPDDPFRLIESASFSHCLLDRAA